MKHEARSAVAAADRAARKLGRELGHPAWLRGIAVEPCDRGYVLTVRVARAQPHPPLPEKVDGVSVRVVERGVARALGASAETDRQSSF